MTQGDPAGRRARVLVAHGAPDRPRTSPVAPRFDAQGVRVVQLLLSKGHLEQKQVADLTMGPQKETRELLYR